MNKSFILITSLLFCIGIKAEIPSKLEKEINTQTATEIYNAMDRFAADVDTDAIAEIAYDCWPIGRKMLTRRIEIPLAQNWPERSRQKNCFKEVCDVFDSCRREIGGSHVKKTIDSISSVRVYDYGRDPEAFEINRKAGRIVVAESREAAVATLKDEQIILAQILSFAAPQPTEDALKACADTLTKLYDTLRLLPISKGERTVMFTAETKSSGILRVRSYMKEEEVTQGKVMYLSCSDLQPIWRKIYESYMSFMDYDADISLTYMRKNRMLMLYSPTSHILNAACIKENIIYMFTGSYSGTNPFLPSNWTNSVRINRS
ncbi:MAG: hypothetical protein K2L05_04210 [Muribaculaceae bacterium]|nr:hypothetical protein [Muribaculaceae bacterium]